MDSGHYDNLRVSDAERARAGQLLERSVGEGMLTLDEYTERIDVALAARTRGELNAVLADLPGMQLGVPSGGRPAVAPEELRGWMSSIVRGRVRMGSVTVRHPFGTWLRRLHGMR